MIEVNPIRLAFRNKILTAGIVPSTSYQGQNIDFDPTGKTLWIRERWIPTEEKKISQLQSDVIFLAEYDIFTPVGSGMAASSATEISIKNLFDINDRTKSKVTITGYPNYLVHVQKTTSDVSDENGWNMNALILYVQAIYKGN